MLRKSAFLGAVTAILAVLAAPAHALLSPLMPVVRVEPGHALALGLDVERQLLSVAERFDFEVRSCRHAVDHA